MVRGFEVPQFLQKLVNRGLKVRLNRQRFDFGLSPGGAQTAQLA